ncbi:hypothetical protein ABN028_19815 [Actinopolymorpha sp. B17G11]|uniref:hypothetical protein n=1 Tax=Actinopolymorpha sp. B17G11 TaxID=3160861 RepID=UPI0032E4DC04
MGRVREWFQDKVLQADPDMLPSKPAADEPTGEKLRKVADHVRGGRRPRYSDRNKRWNRNRRRFATRGMTLGELNDELKRHRGRSKRTQVVIDTGRGHPMPLYEVRYDGDCIILTPDR